MTIGEQRLIAFKYAAAIWCSKLASPVPIRVRSSFGSLPCTAKSGTLAATATPECFSQCAASGVYSKRLVSRRPGKSDQ